MLSVESWISAWKSLGVEATGRLTSLREDLQDRYREPHRHYHTTQHLEECAARLAELQESVSNLAEVQLALWFHDAVYDPRRHDNEMLSADWARDEAVALGAAAGSAERIHTLILCTRHNAEPHGPDAEVLVDVDLAILGAAQPRFDEYEEQVRREYVWVPEAEFRQKRAEILRGFLTRPRIYSTALFRNRHETAARENLQRSIDRLLR